MSQEPALCSYCERKKCFVGDLSEAPDFCPTLKNADVMNTAKAKLREPQTRKMAQDEEWEINAWIFDMPELTGSLDMDFHAFDSDSPLGNDDLGAYTDSWEDWENFGDTGNMGESDYHFKDVGDWAVWYWIEASHPPEAPELISPAPDMLIIFL